MSLHDRYVASISKWRCNDLRDELVSIGLSKEGNNAQLIQRLQDHLRIDLATQQATTTTHTNTTPPQPPGSAVNTPSSPYTSPYYHPLPTSNFIPMISQPPFYTAAAQTTLTANMTTMPCVESTRINPATQQSELHSLQYELQVLKTKEEIRNVQHRLTQPLLPGMTSQALEDSTLMTNSMLSLVKKSVDINSLPPTKPFIFSGNAIDYPRWKSRFDLMLESKDLQPHQKLIYLEEFLSGEALESVQGLNVLNTPDAYAEARKILEDRFGDPYDIADAYIDKLEKWPQIDSHDSRGLRKYSDFLKQVTIAQKTLAELSKLDDPRVLKCFPSSLPPTLLNKWSRVAGTHKLDNKAHISFQQYAEFVSKEAFIANDSTTSLSAIYSMRKNTNVSNHPTSTRITRPPTHIVHAASATDRQDTSSNPTAICHICQTFAKHHTSECPAASTYSPTDLHRLMKRENLCSSCLRRGHQSTACYINIICSTCRGNHATCLHGHEILSSADNL